MGGMGMGGAGSMGWIGMILQALSGIGAAVSTGVYDEAFSDMMRGLNKTLFDAEHRVKDLASELDFPEVTIDPMQLVWTFMNPNANPALAGLTTSALQGLGMPTAGTMEEGSPQARLVNQLGSMGLTHQQYNNALKKLAAGESSKKIAQALTQAGYSSREDFDAAQAQWSQASAEQQARYEAIRPEIEAGRMSALEAISRIQGDYVAPTEADIRALEQRVIGQRMADINYETEQAREAALQQANVMGYNPARTVGDIEQRRLNQIYDVQQSDALERAIALLSGQQGLQTTALASLSGSLAAPTQAATAAAGLYSQGAAQMGDTALRQALATNELTSMAQFFNAGQQTNEQIARMNMLLQALGLHVQGETATLQGEYQKQTSFARGIDKFTSMYSGGGQSSSNGLSFS